MSWALVLWVRWQRQHNGAVIARNLAAHYRPAGVP